MNKITAITVEIDKNEVYRYLSYNGHAPPAFVSSLIDSQIEKAYKLIKPTYTYSLKAINDIRGHKVFLEGSLILISGDISYVLSDCKYVAIFLVTIGKDLERECLKLNKKNRMLEAIMLDAIGTEAVEKTACKLEDAIEELAKMMECQATLRYCPGYCDWDITQQKTIFQAIDSTSIGVKLTEGCMMAPLKSISGIIGIGKFDKTKPPPCLACGRKESCPYKRERL